MTRHHLFIPTLCGVACMLCAPTVASPEKIDADSDRAKSAAAPATPALRTGPIMPAWMTQEIHNTPEREKTIYRRERLGHDELEREMRRLRFEFFRTGTPPAVREVGISRARRMAAPENYPVWEKVFGRDNIEVRRIALDELASMETQEADAVLAWAALRDRDERYRAVAEALLARRLQGSRETPVAIIDLLGRDLLSSRDERRISRAASLADNLNIAGLIPHLIAAQVSGQTATEQSSERGALAWILVGRQRAFVSDLTPVVADAAVAFDPTLSVITDGVMIRVFDAHVFTYRTEVHRSLTSLSSRLWGKSTSRLGYDQQAWADWYLDEFLPAMDAKAADNSGG